MIALPWEDYLPALEAWVRRTGEVVRGEADEDAPLPAFDVVPSGALTPELLPRARAAVAEMDRLQELGAHRHSALQRAQAYATS